MKTKFLILMVTIVLILSPLISAAEPNFVTMFGRNYSLSVGVDINGIAATALNTQCNLTMTNNLGNYIAFQENMSINDAGDASLLINASALREIAQYPFKVACISGGLNRTVPGILETTSTGEDDNNNIYLVLVLGISAFIVLGFGIATENEWVGFIAGILFFLTSIHIFAYGIFSYQNLYSAGLASVFFIFGAWTNMGAGIKVLDELKVKFS